MPFSRVGKLAQALVRDAVPQEARAAFAPGGDVPLGDDLTLGDLVLDSLVACFGRENGGETINRCERLVQLLEPGEEGVSVWRPVVLTTADCFALTAPGRCIYVTEGLLRSLSADEAPLALILAHEISHHTLGHVASTDGLWWREWLGERAVLPALTRTSINRLLFSAEQEYAADSEGLALCHRAGVDLIRCLALFDQIASWEETARTLGAPLPGDWLSGSTPFRAWLRERLSGYPTPAARKEAAEVQRILLQTGGAMR
ncbi:MAG: hypothetical protein QOE70_1343 [Chthoniobacter sp.]|jgi:hypothetical protein|nr:hypothetical protein [Chthoniobacter sp.]